LISRIGCCSCLWTVFQKSKSRLLSNKSTWCHRHGGFTFSAVSQPSNLSTRLKFSVAAGHYPLPLPAVLISLWSRALKSSRSTPTSGNRHIREHFCIRLIFGASTPPKYQRMMFWLHQFPAPATQRWGEPRSLWLENQSWATPATCSSALHTSWLIICRRQVYSKTCPRSEIHWPA